MTGEIVFMNHTTYSKPDWKFVNQGYISHSGPANLTLWNLTFLHGDLDFNLASTFRLRSIISLCNPQDTVLQKMNISGTSLISNGNSNWGGELFILTDSS